MQVNDTDRLIVFGDKKLGYAFAVHEVYRFSGQNIPEPLYAMRDDRNAFARRKFKYRINEFRVRIKAARLQHLPLNAYLYALRPLAVGLLPGPVYQALHKRRLEKRP